MREYKRLPKKVAQVAKLLAEFMEANNGELPKKKGPSEKKDPAKGE